MMSMPRSRIGFRSSPVSLVTALIDEWAFSSDDNYCSGCNMSGINPSRWRKTWICCSSSSREEYVHPIDCTHDGYGTDRMLVSRGCIRASSDYTKTSASVPARYASITIVRQLFARVSVDDNVEANVSTFAAEMRETAFILRNIDKRSMYVSVEKVCYRYLLMCCRIIIDELGRGTSTRDGLAIALAVAEALVESKVRSLKKTSTAPIDMMHC